MSKSMSVARFPLLDSHSYIFTKPLRPAKILRFSGVIIVVHIEDGTGISYDYETALMQSKFVRETLLNVGFVPNTETLIGCLRFSQNG